MLNSMMDNAGDTGQFFDDACAYTQDVFHIREKDVCKDVQVVDISMSGRPKSLPRIEGSGGFKGLSLTFVLEGKCAFETECFNLESGKDSTCMIYLNDTKGITQFHTLNFRCICIMLQQAFLDQGLFDLLPLGRKPGLLLRNSPTDPVSQVCLRDLFAGQYQGVLNDIFTQGKILELLAVEFSHILPQKVTTPAPGFVPLTRQDVNAIKKARQILVRAIADPPSIPALSRMVGINQFKFKKGFRQVFNTTPYAIVRDHRMKTARQLLRSSEYNVAEISLMVGIKNPSHFSRIFARHYGQLPRDVMKTRTYIDLKQKQ